MAKTSLLLAGLAWPVVVAVAKKTSLLAGLSRIARIDRHRLVTGLVVLFGSSVHPLLLMVSWLVVHSYLVQVVFVVETVVPAQTHTLLLVLLRWMLVLLLAPLLVVLRDG